MLTTSTLDALQLQEQLARELSIVENERYLAPESKTYAIHVTLLLHAEKVKSYLRDCGTNEFKERFGL